MSKPTLAFLAVHLAQTVSLRPRNSDLLLARMFGKYEKAEANARLLAAAWNACAEINPENPIAAAEAMPEIWRALNDALPIIEAEADQRDDAGQYEKSCEGSYWREMRDLAERIDVILLK